MLTVLANQIASSSIPEESGGHQETIQERVESWHESHFNNANSSEESIFPSPKRFKMNTTDTQNNTFLFTSESVGEGHPGKF